MYNRIFIVLAMLALIPLISCEETDNAVGDEKGAADGDFVVTLSAFDGRTFGADGSREYIMGFFAQPLEKVYSRLHDHGALS